MYRSGGHPYRRIGRTRPRRRALSRATPRTCTPSGAPLVADQPDTPTDPAAAPAFLVFSVAENGSACVVGYGPDHQAEAEAMAQRLRGIVVAAPIVADFRR